MRSNMSGTNNLKITQGALQIITAAPVSVLALVLVLLLSAPTLAQETTSVSSLEGFIDGVMERGIVRGETVGGVVALVQDGRMLVARGYGMADVTNGVPVQARVTTFRLGSITKVLTWIAVMQQVEAGKLDLDADVDDYLTDLQLPEDYADPITLRHLMTHSAGFEDDLSELFVGGPRQLHSLAETLREQMPERVRLPGTLVAYSNYGTALAGHLVATVTGMDWHDYVQAQILGPLQMNNSSTRQPLPQRLLDQRSKGFMKTARGFEEQNFGYIPLAPAGSASATAQDVARLMAELLNPRDTGVLTARSKALLLGGALVPAPNVNGMTLGMYEMSMGTPRAVGHDGSTMLFYSRMILWPQQNLGLFVSVNSDIGGALVFDLAETVAKRLGLTGWPTVFQPVDGGERYAGEYISGRRNFSDHTRILGLLNNVTVAYDRVPDLLRITDFQGEKAYRQIAQNTFQQVDGYQRVVFGRFGGAGNEVAGLGEAGTLYRSSLPMMGFERAEGLDQLNANLLVLGVWAVLAASVLLGWPVATISRLCQVTAGGTLLTLIVFASIGLVLWFFIQLTNLGSTISDFVIHGIKQMPDLLWYPAAFCALVLLQIGFLYRVWLGSLWWPLRRVHFTIMLAANCLLVWWLWYWRLLPEAVTGVFA